MTDATDVEKDLERMKIYREDVAKTMEQATKQLSSCHDAKQLNDKVLRSHAAIMKLMADFTYMLNKYDENLKKQTRLVTEYHAMFHDLKRRLEYLQRLCDHIAQANATGERDILTSSPMRQTVKYLDEELRKLRRNLGASDTGRHIEESLSALYDVYTAASDRDRPVPQIPGTPAQRRDDKGKFATASRALRSRNNQPQQRSRRSARKEPQQQQQQQQRSRRSRGNEPAGNANKNWKPKFLKKPA